METEGEFWGEELMMSAKVHDDRSAGSGESLTTEQKRVYLRKWAVQVSGGDVSKLPTIREARHHIREHMGDNPGAGMGTDVITKVLRELRDEMTAKKPEATAAVPTTPGEYMDHIGRIAQMMKAAGLQSLAIDEDGFPLKFERFQK